ncbi:MULTISPECIES: c-type cytochrome [Tenebrionibacter/Tenebrionicola group]|jgi:cytochrome c553|uniref:Cytochrome c n=2 Tax=Tenebrionibacter/Tenebrionicola group TaxID=2969848 RepID=A0A8K0V2B6_9ENTR|nr:MULTISPECIES: cytochrome c [Tenebrionibacter/Tenebrionicola group]MBK4714058.1 cytochrome c [Tenebrionibacter intestinalis]MBV4412594.1 cytochrome c [Tenebrionicola larvae]MBV5094453.1 cytochrome c [Tenebrionicola larvae]
MMKRAVLVMGLLALSLPTLAKGDPQAGESKAAMCVACHGAEGVSSVPLYPSIAGQSEAYLSQAMHAYKKGERSGGQAEIMKAYVSGLSDEDIENLAAYYASKGNAAH